MKKSYIISISSIAVATVVLYACQKENIIPTSVPANQATGTGLTQVATSPNGPSKTGAAEWGLCCTWYVGPGTCASPVTNCYDEVIIEAGIGCERCKLDLVIKLNHAVALGGGKVKEFFNSDNAHKLFPGLVGRAMADLQSGRLTLSRIDAPLRHMEFLLAHKSGNFDQQNPEFVFQLNMPQ